MREAGDTKNVTFLKNVIHFFKPWLDVVYLLENNHEIDMQIVVHYQNITYVAI